ncbi:TetR/AcrR family transcriptional regulator [Rhizobium sp. LCM 4573]|uniref:TetR/AcrR family transcriptional regulator n=1 Tax=Rhizobium sp. LCM 4573 TaxID=1848291 RepID=UPI0008D98B6D|nr:TetR/AcrR family transcriptional regulator [Rhizobium sp. LCM 4573]OHV84636.1 TetR family transcriptional regulator [Rhizobium sp. LCM 4573]
MARPREFDRDVALAKARDAFWASGYEGTSISDLVAILGLAPARLYAAFGSKEELFREAVALYEAGEGSFVSRALLQEPTARDAVMRMFREAVQVYTRPGKPRGCLVVSAASSSAVENDAVREFLAERRRLQEESIVARFRRAVSEGELPTGTDAEALGGTIAAILNGLSVQARDGAPPEKLEAMCAFAIDALFGTERQPLGKSAAEFGRE